MEEVISAKPLSLYKLVTYTPAIGPDNVFDEFYLQKEGEGFVTEIVSLHPFAGFRKKAIKYFKDCNDLSEKIRKREFTKNSIDRIVVYYNSKCVKK